MKRYQTYRTSRYREFSGINFTIKSRMFLTRNFPKKQKLSLFVTLSRDTRLVLSEFSEVRTSGLNRLAHPGGEKFCRTGSASAPSITKLALSTGMDL